MEKKTKIGENLYLHDTVYKPSHYTYGTIECIDYIQDKLSKEEFTGACKFNVIKYVSRAGKKDNTKQDLQKAKWYIDKWIESL